MNPHLSMTVKGQPDYNFNSPSPSPGMTLTLAWLRTRNGVVNWLVESLHMDANLVLIMFLFSPCRLYNNSIRIFPQWTNPSVSVLCCHSRSR